MRRIVIACFVVGFLGLSGTALIWSGVVPSPFDATHGAVVACVEKTKEQLRSPSSFVLIWSDYTPREPISWEDAHPKVDYCALPRGGNDAFTNAFSCYNQRLEPKVREKMRKGLPLQTEAERNLAEILRLVDRNKQEFEVKQVRNLPEDKSAFVTLEYDADNGFGSSIRSFGICRFGAIGSDRHFAKSDIVQSGPVTDESGRQAKEISQRLAEH